jgi:hypothetical protein
MSGMAGGTGQALPLPPQSSNSNFGDFPRGSRQHTEQLAWELTLERNVISIIYIPLVISLNQP